MQKIWEFHNNDTWEELFLKVAIGLFVGISCILYFMIIRSRHKKIRNERLLTEYNAIIEKLMFSVAFQDSPCLIYKEDKEYMEYAKNTFFRETLTKSIINLHKNYEGIYATKLEEFYRDSGLINKSLKKLKSLNWEIKCKGITELAEMNVIEAFESILTTSKYRNKTLKITALNACIKLAGVKGIVHLAEHQYPIDDWTQINIISAFKKHDIGDTKGVELLLESKNTTVISLGLKLIKELKLTQKVRYVEELVAKAPNTLIKYEAQNIVQAFNNLKI